MLINADQPGSQPSTPNLLSINWEISVASAASLESGIAHLCSAFTYAAMELALPFRLDSQTSPSLLLDLPTGYRISLSTTHDLNTVHPESLTGVGEIGSSHGPIPILALWLVHKQLSKFGFNNAVSFVDHHTNLFFHVHFTDLKPLFEQLEMDYDQIVQLGRQHQLLPSLFGNNDAVHDVSEVYYF